MSAVVMEPPAERVNHPHKPIENVPGRLGPWPVNQVVAAALSLGTFLMLWFADSVAYLLPRPFELFAVNLSLIGHFKPLANGEVFLSDIGYFITLSLLGLFLTTRRLMER